MTVVVKGTFLCVTLYILHIYKLRMYLVVGKNISPCSLRAKHDLLPVSASCESYTAGQCLMTIGKTWKLVFSHNLRVQCESQRKDVYLGCESECRGEKIKRRKGPNIALKRVKGKSFTECRTVLHRWNLKEGKRLFFTHYLIEVEHVVKALWDSS